MIDVGDQHGRVVDQYTGLMSDNTLYNNQLNIFDTSKHTEYIDGSYDGHEGRIVNKSSNRSVSEFLEVKQTDGWVYTYGTKQDNQILTNNYINQITYGSSGNDVYQTDTLYDYNSKVNDFTDGDKIQLKPAALGCSYQIQSINNAPVVVQNCMNGLVNSKVLRVEGPKAAELLRPNAINDLNIFIYN